MTPEHAALFAAVRANPADDLPRLVLADYLEETGEPELAARAHFIRAQVTMATAARRSPEYAAAAALADRALDMFGDAWAFDLPAFLRDGPLFTYRRGLVDAVELPFLTFVAHAAELFAACPVTDLTLTRVPRAEEPFAAAGVFDRIPGLANVATLRLGPGVSTLNWTDGNPSETLEHPVLDDLMACRTLTAVRQLDLSDNYLDDAWAVRFVSRLPAAAFARTLRDLDLSKNYYLGDGAANVLAAAAGLDALTRLSVRGTRMTRAGLGMLRSRFGDRVKG